MITAHFKIQISNRTKVLRKVLRYDKFIADSFYQIIIPHIIINYLKVYF